MVSRALSTSRRFALAGKDGGEFAQLLYVLLLPHCDDFGRQSGDTFTVKHQVFPASDKDEPAFEAALAALTRHGLIQRYQVGDEWIIQVTQFEAHQVGLHKRTASRFPEFPGNSGKFPGVPSEQKGIEGNGREGEGRPSLAPVLAGTFPRDHVNCGWCGERFCVSAKQWTSFIRAYGEGGEAATLAWVRRIHDGLGPHEAYGGGLWLAKHHEAWLIESGRVKAPPTKADAAAQKRAEIRRKAIAGER